MKSQSASTKTTTKPKSAYVRPVIPFTGKRKKRVLKAVLEEQAKVDTAGLYVPPRWAYEYLTACLDPDVLVSIKHRCKAAGISKQTYYNHEKDPEFMQWFDQRMQQHVGNASALVREAHLRLCLKENLDAIIDFSDRYIPRSPEVVAQMPVRGVFRNVTPAQPEILESSTERSEGYRQLLGRVVEHHIQKAKAFGIADRIPEEWAELSEAMDKEKADGAEFH